MISIDDFKKTEIKIGEIISNVLKNIGIRKCSIILSKVLRMSLEFTVNL